MKKILSVLLSIGMLFSLSACAEEATPSETTSEAESQSQSEISTENEDTGNDTNEDVSDEVAEDAPEEEEGDYLTLTYWLNSAGDGSDTMDVTYKEDGVHVHFFDSPKFGNGYAYIKDARLFRGEAEFYIDGEGSTNSQPLHFVNMPESVFVSHSIEDIYGSGVEYLKDLSVSDAFLPQLIGNEGEDQHWTAYDFSIYSSESGELETANTYTNMTTNYSNGLLTLQIQGDGEWVVDDRTATLEGDFLFSGEFAGGSLIRLYPENDVLILNINYYDSVYMDNRSVVILFEKAGI